MSQNQPIGGIIPVGDNTSGVIVKELKSVAGRDISSTLTIDLAACQRAA